jgi:hypothetical protein
VARFGKRKQFYMERTHCCETGVIVFDSYIDSDNLMYEFQERELFISILKCLVIKYTILPMTEYVEIICPTKDATFLTYTVLRDSYNSWYVAKFGKNGTVLHGKNPLL